MPVLGTKRTRETDKDGLDLTEWRIRSAYGRNVFTTSSFILESCPSGYISLHVVRLLALFHVVAPSSALCGCDGCRFARASIHIPIDFISLSARHAQAPSHGSQSPAPATELIIGFIFLHLCSFPASCSHVTPPSASVFLFRTHPSPARSRAARPETPQRQASVEGRLALAYL